IPWTSEPFVKAITTLNEWWKKGYFGQNYFSLTAEQAFAQIATGKAGMAPTGTWNFQHIPTYFPANNAQAGFTAFPSGEGVPYPVYPLGVGSTFSVAAGSKNADGAAAAIDYVFSDEFYGAINTVWQGEWNTPLKDLSKVKLGGDVLPLYAETMKNLSTAVAQNHYGYTTWTFLPPATDTYLVNGIEEVWLGQLSVEDFLSTLDATFQQEKTDGKVPAVPPRK
ncbi:MAG: ABC transporter substrate-binding protein, partial [Alphaproteobacteria bacterium]